MTPRPTSARIEPVAAASLSDTATELLHTMATRAQIPNLYLTLIHYEGLVRRWLPFGAKVLNGKIPPRDREIMILRTAWNCQSKYEWCQHAVLALDAGLTSDEIDRVKVRYFAGWTEWDEVLLAAADDLHNDQCISDNTWDKLSQRYDTRQLIELPMLVGEYHLVAMTLNSLGVQLDEGLPNSWDA